LLPLDSLARLFIALGESVSVARLSGPPEEEAFGGGLFTSTQYPAHVSIIAAF